MDMWPKAVTGRLAEPLRHTAAQPLAQQQQKTQITWEPGKPLHVNTTCIYWISPVAHTACQSKSHLVSKDHIVPNNKKHWPPPDWLPWCSTSVTSFNYVALHLRDLRTMTSADTQGRGGHRGSDPTGFGQWERGEMPIDWELPLEIHKSYFQGELREEHRHIHFKLQSRLNVILLFVLHQLSEIQNIFMAHLTSVSALVHSESPEGRQKNLPQITS